MLNSLGIGRGSISEVAAELNRVLNIFITNNFELAKELLQIKHREKISCFLFAVKDCFSTAGIQTTCGSAMLSGYVPPYNATVVDRLLGAGGILLGKTNMDEFSMGSSSTQGHFGPVKNPWTLKIWREDGLDLGQLLERMQSDWFITGGSSGGSAVAVACDLVRIALGSDTGGSVRNPAAFCGVVGLKPSYGLISRHGLIPLVNSLDVPAILTRSVRDAAAALKILSGKDEKDSTSVEAPQKLVPSDQCGLRGLRVGVPREFNVDNLSEEVWRTWNDVANWLEEEAGCVVEEVTMPYIQYSIQCYHVLGECEIASNMARYDGVEYGFRAEEGSSVDNMYAEGRHAAINEVVRRRILAGNYFLLRKNYHEYFVQAMKIRRLIASDFWKLFRPEERRNKIDILLTPVTSTDAPLFSEFLRSDGGYDRERQDDYFTQPVNMAGVPAISIPIRLSDRGLPISLQLISDMFEESKLLTAAMWIESRSKFPCLSREEWFRYLL